MKCEDVIDRYVIETAELRVGGITEMRRAEHVRE